MAGRSPELLGMAGKSGFMNTTREGGAALQIRAHDISRSNLRVTFPAHFGDPTVPMSL